MTEGKPLNTEDRAGNSRAVKYMVAAVFLYSLTPIFFHVGEAHQAPVMFNAVRLTGAFIGMTLFLLVFYGEEFLNLDVWRAIRKHVWSWSMLGITIGVFNNAVLAWSLKYIDISIAVIVYESWTILMIVLMGGMFKGEGRYKNVKRSSWIFVAMGYAGLGFVILSQSGGMVSKNEEGFMLLLGVLAALLAAGMGALLNACSIRWGVSVREFYTADRKNNKRLELFFGMIGLLIAGIPNIILGAVWVRLGGHGEIIEVDNMIVAFLYGLLLMVVARVFYKKANLGTSNLKINALFYVLPVLSLLWLSIPGYINVLRLDWLAIGVAGVVAANVILNFKAEKRTAYQSLVVSLWICGVIVYFRPYFGIAWNTPVFYDAIVLAATMFILILSFRVDRLVRRTSEEDNTTIEIWRKISSLADGEMLQNRLRSIDEASTPKKLGEAYSAFVCALKSTTNEISEGGKELFADIMESVNKLAHSKQQGTNFGEQVVLCILGFITAGGLLFFMQEDVNNKPGAGGFFLEAAAFLAAATVIFLLFNIQDLQYDRRRRMLRTKADIETGEEGNPEGLVFREDQDRAGEKIISIVCCLGIVITFGVLLWFKLVL